MTSTGHSAWRTFMFALPGRPAGPLALGTGRTRGEAAAEAIARLDQRGVGRTPGAYGALLRELRGALGEVAVGRSAVEVVCEADGRYPGVGQMGHDYVNNETHQVAATLGSDAKLASLMESVGFEPVEARRRLVAAAREVLRGSHVDLAMVDWSEVALEFMRDEDICSQTGARVPDASSNTADATAASESLSANTRRIDADVLDVLARSRAHGNMVILPPGRMARELYGRVNAVLVALGGQWKGGKVHAHVFPEDAEPLLEVAVVTGRYLRPQDVGYFPTPHELAWRVVELADLQAGMTVLEPSAGRGAIASAAAAVVSKENVACVELLPGNVRHLASLGFQKVSCMDFLKLDPAAMPKFDRLLMNPPFSSLSDVEHVMHATQFLKPNGRLVAITSPSWEHRSNSRRAEGFREFVETAQAQTLEVPAGAFRESGTDIATRILTFEAENFPWNRREVRREREVA